MALDTSLGTELADLLSQSIPLSENLLHDVLAFITQAASVSTNGVMELCHIVHDGLQLIR